jgi:outer membrane protein assembly factor BamE (lipoprotein component of BamABCDE complex)
VAGSAGFGPLLAGRGIRVYSNAVRGHMRRFTTILALAAIGAAATACSTNVAHRGYLARPGSFDQVQKGMAKSEVVALLGSPSTTASVNVSGDSYYYISSTTEQKAFFNAKEIDRQVIAIRFDPNDQVDSFGQYGLEDGKVVDINTRKTPTKGRELTILQQVFGNIGKPGPGGSIIQGRPDGMGSPSQGQGQPF